MSDAESSSQENDQVENPPRTEAIPIASMSGRLIFIRRLVGKLEQIIINLNIFPTIPPTTDPYELQTQRISTRAFIVFFLFAFNTLVIYSSTNTVLRSFTITKPGLTQYDHLFSLHTSALTCSCSQISSQYKIFIQINHSMHPICYSDFITNVWFNYSTFKGKDINADDFRFMSIFIFQAIRSLCQLSEETIQDNLEEFYSQSYISTVLTDRNLLEAKSNALIKQFKSMTTNDFTFFLRMMMDTSHVNVLETMHFPNNALYFVDHSPVIRWEPRYFDDGCYCMNNIQCTSRLAIYQDNNRSLQWYVPGLFRGCFIVEALRKSHLGCLFNQTCLEALHLHMESDIPLPVGPLDGSRLLHFHPNTLIGSVIDELMVDDWSEYQIYEEYYNSCRPIECTFTISGQDSVIGIITTVIGLIGGLITILKLTIPSSVTLIRWIIKPRATLTFEERSIRQHLRHLSRVVIQFLVELNWFPSNPTSTDPYDIQTERFSTRVYVLALLASFTVLIIYTSAVTITNIIVVSSPTIEQLNDLSVQYSKILSCPCSKISSDYSTFITINYSLHPICDSIYITDQWFEYTSFFNRSMLNLDFRTQGTLYFQTIQSFCELAEDNIKSNLAQFLSNEYISTSAMPEQLFKSQIDAIIRHFLSSITNTFTLSLTLMRSTTQYNGLLSALFTNFVFFRTTIPGYVSSIPCMIGYDCNCAYTASCFFPAIIYANHSTAYDSWNVPGFYGGCFILESVLQSRLECLFDLSCLQELDLHWQSSKSINMTPLNLSVASPFTPGSRIETIVNSFMVDEWKWNVRYEKYLEICRPNECTYTVTSTRTIVLIITTLIGLFGGLVTSFKLIIPRLVGLIRWKLKPRVSIVTEQTLKQKLYELLYNTVRYLITLNLFPTYPPSEDRQKLRKQRISTRAFIIIFCLVIIILFIYTSTATYNYIVTFQKPDYEQYSSLFSLHAQTLKCPCSQIATNYDTIIDLNYSIHPICNSQYVTNAWITYLRGNSTTFWYFDFRVTGTFQFQALQSLCQLVINVIGDQLRQFFARVYISTEVVEEEHFVNQMNISTQQFLSGTKNSFQLSFKTIRDITQANGIISALQKNIGLYVTDPFTIVPYLRTYNNSCSCIERSDCIQPSGFISSNGMRATYVPGFYDGCFVLESLRKSNLICFYSQVCMNGTNTLIASNEFMDMIALNRSSLIHFLPNTTIGEIIDEMMVDKWNIAISHIEYYNSCQPVECNYEVVRRNSMVAIVTALIGVSGGLMTTLKLIVPRIVAITFRLWQRRKRNAIRNAISPTTVLP